MNGQSSNRKNVLDTMSDNSGTRQIGDCLQFDMSFDEWQALAKSDPALFEAARRQLLQTCIDQSSNSTESALFQGALDLLRLRRPNQALVSEESLIHLKAMILEVAQLAERIEEFLAQSAKTSG